MLNHFTDNWRKHCVLVMLRRNFEREEWNSLVRATTLQEMQEFLHLTKTKLDRLMDDLQRNEEVLAVDNRRAFLLHPKKGMLAAVRQKYLQRIYRTLGGLTFGVLVVLVMVAL